MPITLDSLRASQAFKSLSAAEQAQVEGVYRRSAQLEGDPSSLSAKDLQTFLATHSPSESARKAATFLQGQLNAAPAIAAPTRQASKTKRDDLAGAAAHLLKSTVGRKGTDEEQVNMVLQAAYAFGKIPDLNREVGQKLRAQGKALDVPAAKQDGYLRWVIDEEMSGSQRQRAIDFLEVGHDRLSSSDWAYRLEGVLGAFDKIGDGAKEHPWLTAGAVMGGVGLSILFPPAAAMVGLGVMGYGGGKVLVNEAQARFFSGSQAERVQNLMESGEGASLAVAGAPSLAGVGTIRAAIAAAQGAPSLPQALATFMTYGGALQTTTVSGGSAASAAQATEASSAEKAQWVQMFVEKAKADYAANRGALPPGPLSAQHLEALHASGSRMYQPLQVMRQFGAKVVDGTATQAERQQVTAAVADAVRAIPPVPGISGDMIAEAFLQSVAKHPETLSTAVTRFSNMDAEIAMGMRAIRNIR